MLIGVVGMNGSGKDAVGKYLAARHGFACIDIGQVIRDDLKAMGRNYLDRTEMRDLGNEMRKKFGTRYWCKRAIESVNAKDIVITSIRNQGEVEEIISRGGTIIEVFADERTRFNRTVARVSEEGTAHGDTTFEEFKEHERIEFANKDLSKMQVAKAIAAAQYKIDNNGAIDQLYKNIDKMLADLRAKETKK